MLSRQACRLRLLSEAALHQPQKPTNQQPSISAPRPRMWDFAWPSGYRRIARR
jgi:hypothetical protein